MQRTCNDFGLPPRLPGVATPTSRYGTGLIVIDVSNSNPQTPDPDYILNSVADHEFFFSRYSCLYELDGTSTAWSAK